MSMIISFIIPLYNCEQYVDNCIKSILSTGLDRKSFEIIIVNDGSTDGGPILVQQYVEQYHNIYLITQDNQGLSGARNTGISHAKGDYLWFIDADDEINEHAVDAISIINEIDDLDFLGIQMLKVDANKNFISSHCVQELIKKNIVITGRDAILKGYNPSSACALIMRRKFIEDNNLKFKIGMTHEDVEFTYRAMCKAQKVMFSDIVPYFYYRRGNTMSTPNDKERLIKYVIDDVYVATSFRSLSEEYLSKDYELYKKIFLRSQSIVFGLTYQMYRKRKKWSPLGINKILLQELKLNGLYPLHKPFYSWKQHCASFFLNFEFIY